MIEPLPSYEPAKVPRDEAKRRERCTAVLDLWRQAWRLLEDAGVHEPFKGRIMQMSWELKKAMGGKEVGDE